MSLGRKRSCSERRTADLIRGKSESVSVRLRLLCNKLSLVVSHVEGSLCNRRFPTPLPPPNSENKQQINAA